MRGRLGGFAALGFALGLATGAILWGSQMRRHKRDLFNPSRVRRLAALGYLGGGGDVASALLLRDYVRWEQSPALRKRGENLLSRVERGVQGQGRAR